MSHAFHTKKVGILTGPTASGKSQLALQFALAHPQVELLNADSLCIYRGMDIGTAKPTQEDQHRSPHHLLDLCNPNEPFTTADFLRMANQKLREIHERGHRACIVGGAGFYIKALLFGIWEAPGPSAELRQTLLKQAPQKLFHQLQAIDSSSAQRIGPHDQYRLIRALEIYQVSGQTPSQLQAKLSSEPSPHFELWVIDREKEELNQRIRVRTSQMLEAGWVEEYQKLAQAYPQATPLNAVGYRQIGNYINQISPSGRKIEPGLKGLQEEIILATQQLAKKQRTWFKNLAQLVPKAKKFFLESGKEALIDTMRNTLSE